jgi:hypothetical protein
MKDDTNLLMEFQAQLIGATIPPVKLKYALSQRLSDRVAELAFLTEEEIKELIETDKAKT